MIVTHSERTGTLQNASYQISFKGQFGFQYRKNCLNLHFRHKFNTFHDIKFKKATSPNNTLNLYTLRYVHWPYRSTSYTFMYNFVKRVFGKVHR